MPPVFGPGRREPERARPVGEREQRYLLALEQLLHEHPSAERGCGREPGVDLLLRAADEHALARGEPIGLDHAGRPGNRQPSRRRNAGRLEYLLGERLRTLDARRCPGRPEDRDAGSSKRVGKSRDERCLGPYDDEVDPELAAEREHPLAVLGAHRMAHPERRDPRVAGRRVQLGEGRALAELPRQRVLAAPRAHDEHLHGGECTVVTGVLQLGECGI
jgi:hypothetical protein